MKNNISELDKKIINLTKGDSIDISDIENLLINNIEEYKIELYNHVEKLLLKQVDENKIIAKKQAWKNKKIYKFYHKRLTFVVKYFKIISRGEKNDITT